MKTEVGSFTPASGTVTVYLNDATLDPKGIFFEVGKNGSNVNYSSGFSDTVGHKSAWTFKQGSLEDSGRSGTKAILHKKIATTPIVTALEATCTAFRTGEFDVNFTTYDNSYTVNFMVVGD